MGVRIAASFVFIAAGAFKFILPAPGPNLHSGARGFGEVLASLHVPLAALFSYLVPLTELIGGVSLLLNRGTRYWAALLSIDMSMAIGLVGVPGLLGHPLKIGRFSIGAETWRLPLEVGLLLSMLWLALPRHDAKGKM